MAVIVTDAGFRPEDWRDGFVPLAGLTGRTQGPTRPGVDLGTPALTRDDWQHLCAALPGLDLVRIRLRHFGDTAALALAQALRAEGFSGRLRAHGAVLASLYTLTRRAGFDEVELDHDQARLQPGEHWRNEIRWVPGARRAPAGAICARH